MLLTPRVGDGLLGMLKIVKNSDYINTEYTSKWRDIAYENFALYQQCTSGFLPMMSYVEGLSHDDFRCHLSYF